ncbi:cellulase [Sarracenia purpurea var. burkii]
MAKCVQLSTGIGTTCNKYRQLHSSSQYTQTSFRSQTKNSGAPEERCPEELLDLAKAKVDYIQGSNPMNLSCLVGYGQKYHIRVHHRGASLGAPKGTITGTVGRNPTQMFWSGPCLEGQTLEINLRMREEITRKPRPARIILHHWLEISQS